MCVGTQLQGGGGRGEGMNRTAPRTSVEGGVGGYNWLGPVGPG